MKEVWRRSDIEVKLMRTILLEEPYMKYIYSED